VVWVLTVTLLACPPNGRCHKSQAVYGRFEHWAECEQARKEVTAMSEMFGPNTQWLAECDPKKLED
jgi:hypothetical protein